MRRVSIIIVAAIVLAGCGPEVAKVAGGIAERAAVRAAAEDATVAIGPSLSRAAARSTVLSGRTDAVALRSEAAAAGTIADSPALREMAQESDAKVTAIAATTTRDTASRARVIACARGGALAGARSYAGSYLDDDSGTEVADAVSATVKSCLQKAFPSQASAVGYLSDAATNAVLASSREAAEAQATAQQYADWLVYTASLYGEDGAIAETGTTVTAPSATAVSIDDLLVVLYHAQSGRRA